MKDKDGRLLKDEEAGNGMKGRGLSCFARKWVMTPWYPAVNTHDYSRLFVSCGSLSISGQYDVGVI